MPDPTTIAPTPAPDVISHEGMTICGVFTPEQAAGSLARWNKRDLKIAIAGTLTAFAAEDFSFAVLSAARLWSGVAGVTFELTTAPAEADILVTTGHIDGPSKTLAWSELPPGDERRLTQKYDAAEPWIIALNPPSNRIDLTRVVAHEIGHAIGIPHIGPGNLMSPTYSVSIRQPLAGDISEARARYGEPRPPAPPVPPPGEDYLEVYVAGVKARTPLVRIAAG